MGAPPYLTVIETTAANALASKVSAALSDSILGKASLDPEALAIDGMSGKKYRTFINALIASLPDARYLEIGVWQGSTLCAAIHNNNVRALAIDNWALFDGPADRFFANLARFKGKASVSFLDSDFRAIDYSTMGKFNVYLFDGPHEQRDQHDGICLAQPALDDQFVLIIDDWNWPRVREGTFAAIDAAQLRLDFVAEIRTALDGTDPPERGKNSDWHNGYFIAACSKLAR